MSEAGCTCIPLVGCCWLQEVHNILHVGSVGGLLGQADHCHLSHNRQHRIWDSARVQGGVEMFLRRVR